MSIIKEFKEFAIKGDVIDLAVAVVIGTAFGKIVSSLVDDIIMPLAGLIMGKVDFSTLSLSLGGDNELPYGSFIQNIVEFLIIAFSVFLMVKFLNSFRKKNEDESKKKTKKKSKK